LLVDQIASQFGKPTDIPLSPPILDPDILAFNITGSRQTIAKRRE
jgi:hypothetical protein